MKPEERQKINEELGNFRNMKQKRSAERKIMQATPELHGEYNKMMKCSFHRPCGRSTCDHCGGGIPYRFTQGHEYVYEKKADPKQSRGKSKNFRSRAGHWMMKPFKLLDENRVYPFTIDFYIEDRNMDGKESTRRERVKFQSFLKQEMPDAVVRIICDISICSVNTQYLFIPDDSIHSRYQDNNRLPEFGFNFHGHGLIWHPFLTQSKIKTKLKEFYPGRDRVSFSTPLPVTENKEGYLSGGLQGWAEYAGMEMTKTDLPYDDPDNDNYSAVQSMLLIRRRWRRSARRITFNDKPARVLELSQSTLLTKQNMAPSIVPDNEFFDPIPIQKPGITSIGMQSIQ
jgi:hypothetical protein